MIPRETNHALADVAVRSPVTVLVRRLRAARLAAARMPRLMTDVQDPQTVVHFDILGCRIYAVDDSKLAIYDITNDEAWIGCEDALDLRNWA